MDNFQRIKHISLGVLSNSEFSSHMSNTLIHILEANKGVSDDENTSGCPALNIPGEILDEFSKDLDLLFDVLSETKAAIETPRLTSIDMERRRLFSFILQAIRSAKRNLKGAKNEAGTMLDRFARPVRKTVWSPGTQLLAHINSFIQDIRKEENEPYVNELQLTSHIDELEKLNQEYESLYIKRIKSQQESQKEPPKQIRARLAKTYDKIILLAQSSNVIMPSEESLRFVGVMNRTVQDTVTAYRLRNKRKWTRSE